MATATDSQTAQAGLVTALGLQLRTVWQQIDLTDVNGSMPRFMMLVAGLIHRYGLASATLADRSYLASRRAAGLTTPFRTIPAPLPPLEEIGANVGWATAPLRTAEPDLPAAEQRLVGAADRLVLNVGRETLIGNVQRDRAAKGWARIPEPGACSFCALLATRGAVYKQDTVGFEAHNHCRCHVEPVFTAYEPSAQVREWQAIYRESARGKSGAEARNAFRRALESR